MAKRMNEQCSDPAPLWPKSGSHERSRREVKHKQLTESDIDFQLLAIQSFQLRLVQGEVVVVCVPEHLHNPTEHLEKSRNTWQILGRSLMRAVVDDRRSL